MAREIFENTDKINILKSSKRETHWDNIWVANYNLLLKYIEEYGNHHFPHSYKTKQYKPEYKKLPKWYIHQRELNVKNDLPKWRYELLEKIGFDFNPLDTQWKEKYKKVKEFAQIYGHCNISQYDEDYPGLGKWLNSQRTNRATLNKTYITLLRALKISWRMYAQEWDEMYLMLKQYYLRKGPIVTTRISHSDAQKYSYNRLVKLNTWAIHQTREYIKGILPNDRIKLLEKLDFKFEKPLPVPIPTPIPTPKPKPKPKPLTKAQLKASKIVPFKEYLAKLKKYKKEYGDYNVALHWNQDDQFIKWVHKLRNSKLEITDSQRKELNKIGFTWSIVDDRWERNFRNLVKFKKKYGHCFVRPENPYKSLHTWVNKIKLQRKNQDYSKLSEERIARLDGIGFIWKTDFPTPRIPKRRYKKSIKSDVAE